MPGRNSSAVSALDPNSAEGHRAHAIYLVTLRRHDEALVAARRARDLSPLSAVINAELATTLWRLSRYDDAIEQLHKTLEINPRFSRAYVEFGIISARKGDLPASDRRVRTGRGAFGPPGPIWSGSATGMRSPAEGTRRCRFWRSWRKCPKSDTFRPTASPSSTSGSGRRTRRWDGWKRPTTSARSRCSASPDLSSNCCMTSRGFKICCAGWGSPARKGTCPPGAATRQRICLMRRVATASVLPARSSSPHSSRRVLHRRRQRKPLPPIDPQRVQDQQDMTWADYRPIPGVNWADPSLVAPRKLRVALVAVDFPDQPFVITLPKQSDLFGNPQIDPIAARRCREVLQGLPRQARPDQSRPDDQRLLDGAVARQGGDPGDRRIRAVPDAEEPVSVRSQRMGPGTADAPAASRATRGWSRTSTPCGWRTPAPASSRTTTSSCGSTPATTRPACGRSSAR